MTRLLSSIALFLSFFLLLLASVAARPLVLLQQGTVTMTATATNTPQITGTVTPTEPSRLATDTTTPTEPAKSDTQTPTLTATSAGFTLTPTATLTPFVFVSPTATLASFPTATAVEIVPGAPPGVETATLAPLPEVTYIFPQATPTDKLLSVSHNPADPALQKQSGSTFWQRVFRFWPILVVLLFWGLLFLWVILAQARVRGD